MFKKYPYRGLLYAGILLWLILLYYCFLRYQDMQPPHLALRVNIELNRKEEKFKTLLADKDLVRRIFTDSLTSAESKMLTELKLYLFGYHNDTLKYWNTNTVIANNIDSLTGKTFCLRNEKGFFVGKSYDIAISDAKNNRLIVLFPIFISYPLENEYLQSHFTASPNIPEKTKIITDSTTLGLLYPITTLDGKKIFYLLFNNNSHLPWVPDTWFFIILFITLFVNVFWLQLIINKYNKNYKPLKGFLITLITIILLRTAFYCILLPFNLENLPFFSSHSFYYNVIVQSLGDLFADLLLILWIANFIFLNSPFKNFLSQIKSFFLKIVGTIVIYSMLMYFIVTLTEIVKKMVLYSNISFDVGHINSNDIYIVFGLLSIVLIIGIATFIIYITHIHANYLIQNKWIRYIVFVITSAIALFLINDSTFFTLTVILWVLLLFILMDTPKLTLVSDLFEPRMIFWALLICAGCTWLIQYFNDIKEKETRKIFVEQHLSPHQDTILENSFDRTANNIIKDKAIKIFFEDPTLQSRKLLNQKLETQYLTGQLNKYQAKIYLFDDKGDELYNKDTLKYNYLLSEEIESAATNSGFLFYKESILDKHFYLAYIPIYEDSTFNLLGHMFIDLDLKKRIPETVYPELLQPAANKANGDENEYAYGIYANNKLVSQTNAYPFIVTLKNEHLREGSYSFILNNNTNELHYKISDKRTVVVVHNHFIFLEQLTLFSYIFGIEVFISLFIILYKIFTTYYRQKSIKTGFFNLGRRIHFSMMAVLLVSFIIIGSFTILFFKLEYDRIQELKLQTAMQVAKQSVKDYLNKENAFANDYLFDSVSRSNNTKYFITALANNQKIDVNIFDAMGNLLNTSQDEIYEKGLISRKIRPYAYFQLNNAEKSIVIEDEKVAALNYKAAYQPLRDEEGVILGYLNVPFFASQKDFNFQVSNIIVALINLYAIIFVVSNIFTLFLTRWITQIFSTITKKFEKLNLLKNELLEWNYDDEIGKLVTEYNKMVKKVEENAALLARSERESAWREMAKQVAHEIKNPLTPMKLNIQYLQQAIKNHNPNIKELADRVSNSIVEQIDNLSYIATEFSNFAKLPEAKPEQIEIGSLLNSALELYLNTPLLKVDLYQYHKKLWIFSDKSQLLRVINNLLENAKQAIPENREGIITVKVNTANNFVNLSITDNGAGIDEEIAKKIFQPYFTTKSSGTGLGLPMSKKIIEYWNGDIWFESQINIGTTFYLKLPLIEDFL